MHETLRCPPGQLLHRTSPAICFDCADFVGASSGATSGEADWHQAGGLGLVANWAWSAPRACSAIIPARPAISAQEKEGRAGLSSVRCVDAAGVQWMQLSTMTNLGGLGGSCTRAEVAVGHFGSSPPLTTCLRPHPACWPPARLRRAAKVFRGLGSQAWAALCLPHLLRFGSLLRALLR